VEQRFKIDSCGTGAWHVGQPPHVETCRVARENGISVEHLKARQVCAEDFKNFDLIVAMDRSNLSDLKRLRGSEKANIICLREYDFEGGDINVPDPYYGGRDGFEEMYRIIRRCSEQLLEELFQQI
jgi:protein-tyrosine phosphatase